MPRSPKSNTQRKPASKGAGADPEQFQRFIEAARELDADVTEEEAERAFSRIVPPRRPGDPLPHKTAPEPVKSGKGRPRKRG
jgi:hypothetical protein